ncbi:outer membrane protein [Escherichia coli HVH 201 (4-4459431)]|nr:outer membrane protein [Escherichia coli HVH 201 (4-4459431)]
MKIISFVLPCLLVLAGCSTPSQPEAPKPAADWYGKSGVGLLPAEGRDAHSCADSARGQQQLQITGR